MNKIYVNLSQKFGRELVGGKAYMMRQLIENSSHALNGIVITTEALTQFLIRQGVSEKEIQDAMLLKEKSINKIRYTIENGVWPEDIKETLREVYDFFDGNICVRSSATNEDGYRHSYAGVFRSNINIRSFGEFLWAIRDVWLSLFEDNTIQYVRNIGGKLPLMALIVQPLVYSIKAGVAILDNDILTISAAYGQGYGVVSGNVNCDTYVFEETGKVIYQDIRKKENCYLTHNSQTVAACEKTTRKFENGHQQSFFIKDIDSRSAIIFCSILKDDYNIIQKPVLTEDQQKRLVKECYRLGKRFSGEKWDIEWAYDRYDRLHILQIRPYISKSVRPYIENNVVENTNSCIYGVPITKGEVIGKVKIIYDDSKIPKIENGDIVFLEWIPETYIGLLSKASGLIIGNASVLSHCAIIAREWGIPCVAGIEKETLVDGAKYKINGENGMVNRVNESELDKINVVNDTLVKKDTIAIFPWLITATDEVLLGLTTLEEQVSNYIKLIENQPEIKEVDFDRVQENIFGLQDMDSIYKELSAQIRDAIKKHRVI